MACSNINCISCSSDNKRAFVYFQGFFSNTDGDSGKKYLMIDKDGMATAADTGTQADGGVICMCSYRAEIIATGERKMTPVFTL